ncbi:MAG TPA: cytochrome c-type biogenesis protein CcmH [Candidatus Limnocylindrales bacterium]|nr:cytochrome c-type biogenesis protein CcmH [Candidatus Limnocylindrales bacterium]
MTTKMITNSIRRSSVALFVFAFAILSASSISAQAPESGAGAKKLGNKIMCMCGGCNDTALKCNHMGGAFSGPCETARAELKELNERVGQGKSDDLVLQSFVQEYGPTVLISPPTNGFDLWAWLMPVIVPLLGIALVWMVVARWRRKMAAADGPPVSPELLARARDGMGRDADD